MNTTLPQSWNVTEVSVIFSYFVCLLTYLLTYLLNSCIISYLLKFGALCLPVTALDTNIRSFSAHTVTGIAMACTQISGKLLSVAECLHVNESFINKKAQLTLSNPRDIKACKNCSNSTCHFTEFHFPEFQSLGVGLYSYTQFEIWCLPIIKFLV